MHLPSVLTILVRPVLLAAAVADQQFTPTYTYSINLSKTKSSINKLLNPSVFEQYCDKLHHYWGGKKKTIDVTPMCKCVQRTSAQTCQTGSEHTSLLYGAHPGKCIYCLIVMTI